MRPGILCCLPIEMLLCLERMPVLRRSNDGRGVLPFGEPARKPRGVVIGGRGLGRSGRGFLVRRASRSHAVEDALALLLLLHRGR
jgi:hypothetical protein